MPSKSPSVGTEEADEVLVDLFLEALVRGYGGREGEPFYRRTLLGQQAEGYGPLQCAAFSATHYVADPDQLSWMYVAADTLPAYTQSQLMEALLNHGAPNCYGPKGCNPQEAEQRLEELSPVFAEAGLLATPLRLPALAVVQWVTDAGESQVEFVTPSKVDAVALISYMQLGHGPVWN